MKVVRVQKMSSGWKRVQDLEGDHRGMKKSKPVYINFSFAVEADERELIVHAHDKYEIDYFYNGNCRYLIGNTWMELEPGDLFITHGMSRHGPLLQKGCMRTVIHFDSAYLKTFLVQPNAVDVLKPFQNLRSHLWRLNGSQKQEVEDILYKVHRFHNLSGLSNFNRMRHAFHELLLFIYDCSQSLLRNRTVLLTEKELHVANAIQFIEQHFMEEINLDALTANIHVSKFYLSRIFRETTGMTVLQYIQKQRIAQAKALLMTDNRRTLTHISQDVGFSQLSHFSSVFKQLIGQSPDQYRKQIVDFMIPDKFP